LLKAVLNPYFNDESQGIFPKSRIQHSEAIQSIRTWISHLFNIAEVPGDARVNLQPAEHLLLCKK